jgi:X-linked retinitis pigmentosa GTPase regulator
LHVDSLNFWTVVKIEAGFQSACINKEGELFLWGRGVFGEYPFPQKILTISNKVKEVSLGNTISVAVDEKGLAWGWGTNTCGELGVGDKEPRIHPFPILSLKGKTVTKVVCGD